MKPHPTPPACAAALAALAITLTPLAAQVVFSESFEAPVVSGFATNTLPSGGKWIGSTQGFGATNRGLYNEAVVWPATPPFGSPYGSQAYLLNGPNNGLTTAQNATGLVVTEGVEVKVSFSTAIVSGNANATYLVQLVAFNVTEDNSKRNDVRTTVGTVLASASGTVTTSDFSQAVTFSYTPTGADPTGRDLGIRLLKPSGSVLYDNIRIIVGHDFDQNPENGVKMPAGNTVLSWTNMPPNAPVTDTYVDVFFGTNPGNLAQVVDGGLNTSTTSVNAAGAGTYYWRVDSYPDGNPNGTPVTGDVFFFVVTDSDGDGIPDAWEIQYFGSATGANANADPDNDGLTNLQEFIRGTNPNNPDTDGDGLLDGVETATGIWVSASDTGTHPLVADTDGDGLLDGVETNTGVWVSASNTGTNPINPDTDGDGLLDGWETNTGVFVSRFNTGTNPHMKDTDGDGAWDYYEVAAAFTNPNDPNDTPSVPYPLPAPDPNDFGVSDKPVKVYILSGQSNMLGFGKVSGTGDNTLNTITRRFNRFPNLIGPGGQFVARQDVKYRGLVSGISSGPLAPGFGKDSDSIGPELGFGQIMGWFHDEPVLLIKPSIGNRSLGWDILPPGSPTYQYGGNQYAGYGQSPTKWTIGTTPTPGSWYAGKEFDRFFTDESEWAHPDTAVTNAVDVLDNFATQYPDWATQGFEIAGFVWWQGDKDRYDMGHATRYEHNLVQLINTLRGYYGNRYPGKVVPNAPFVLATLGQTTMDSANAAEKAILDAKFAVDGDSGKYPGFAGNVKTVYAHPLSQGGSSNGHYNLNSETYMLVGDALGRAMLEMQDDTDPPLPNPMTFEIAPSAVASGTIGMVATTATDFSGPVEYLFENVTNSNSSGWITTPQWSNGGLTNGQSYTYRVKARDALGNEGDWSAEASATAGSDVTAPSPDPMSFASPPVALGEVSITMTATTASDINGVEYFFDATDGGNDSGWQASPTYTDTGLNSGTTYTYVVRARDSVGNVTGNSAPAAATTAAPDTTPPTPSPMSFASAPTAIGTTAISMSATTASDPSGVEYFFEAVSGGASSGWQTSPNYTNGDLTPGTEYGYRVRARDMSPAQNVTAWSDVLTATTEVPDETPPTPDPMTFATPPTVAGANAISMVATTATDENGVEYFFANLTLGTDSGWQTSPSFTDNGLQPETEYTYQVKARDTSENFNETAFSAPAAATTAAAPSGPGGALIYEPFAQTAGILNGKAGGIGLTGNWTTTTGTAAVNVVNPSSLNYGNLGNADGQANLLSTGNTNGRVTTTGVLADAGLLNHGATLWFSLVFQKTAGGGSNEHCGFAFGTSHLTAGPSGVLMQNTGSGLGFYTRNNSANVATWSGGTNQTAATVGSGHAVPYSTPTLLVGKIEWGATASDAETITLYKVSFTDLETLGTGHSRTVPAFDQSAATTISFTQRNSSGVQTYDEIRFGATYEDVIGQGGPGPGPVASFEISPIASPQTVGTPITGITITAKDAANQTATGFAGTVSFGGTGGFTGTSATFTAGVLNGVSVTPTESGSNLTFTVNDGNGSTGSTTIATIDPASGDPYEIWSGNLPFDGDANADGISNGMAWFLGAADPSANAAEFLPTIEEENGGLVVSFRSLNAASRGTAVPFIEHSSDLGGIDAWTSIAVPDASNTVNGINFVITPDGDYNEISATIPVGEADAGKLFARLRLLSAE